MTDRERTAKALAVGSMCGSSSPWFGAVFDELLGASSGLPPEDVIASLLAKHWKNSS